MILNRDTHNDGHANINLVQQWSVIEPPMYNIDINGDDIADINILIDVEIGKGKYEEMVVFNQAKFITTTSDGVLGWIRSDYDYATGMMKSDFEVSQDYPYYVVAKTTGALIPNTTTPPLLLQLDKHINGKILNTDSDND
ncbi:MAG: hypothetical protein LBG52_01355 [Candidatus Peribacteria bacterium]|jgi:hypothetical protein|nr:hypothetical protein [Candidatus Peribacteria bacterium]